MLGPAPEILTLQACELVIRDEVTKQPSIIGLLDVIGSTSFPVRMPRMFVFLEVTGGHGRTPLEVRIVDADEARPPVMVMQFEFQFDDPIAVTQMPLQLYLLTFPEPGDYHVQVYCAGAMLRQRRLKFRLGPGPAPKR